jgi:hypothetical protein
MVRAHLCAPDHPPFLPALSMAIPSRAAAKIIDNGKFKTCVEGRFCGCKLTSF